MPFRSEKQRRYLWLKHPDIAKRWTKEYGSKPIKKKSIKMSKSSAVKEHRHLVKVLKSGKGLKSEANRQAGELREYLKKKGYKIRKKNR